MDKLRSTARYILLSLFCGVVLAAPQLTLSLSPTVQLAPGTIRFNISITPNPNNRQICFGYAEGELIVRVSCSTLEGDQAPKHLSPIYSSIPPGEYTGFVQLEHSGGEIASRVTAQFQVN